MDFYIYAKSSHRDGLENVRRASALYNLLDSCEPTLCTGDYRAASIAKATMDVKKTMGIDAMGNLPYTMERLDILMYDNEDVTQEMHEQMMEYCTLLYVVGKDVPFDIVDASYFQAHPTIRDKALFFSDEDYGKWFLEFCKGSKKYEMPLLNGNYFFLDVERDFLESFSEVIEEDEYYETISQTQHLLCANVQTCLESLASGKKPVFFQRADKEVLHLELLDKYNIPTAKGKNLDALMEDFENIIANYPLTKKIELFDASNIEAEINSALKEHAHIYKPIDYGY